MSRSFKKITRALAIALILTMLIGVASVNVFAASSIIAESAAVVNTAASSPNLFQRIIEFFSSIIEKLKSWFSRIEPIPNPDKLCLERIAQVLDLIESKDKEGLKTLFSSQALIEVNDIDQQIDDLFEYFDSGFISWAYVSKNIHESILQGERTYKYGARFNVQTETQQYRIVLAECYYDNTNKNNVGIELIAVRKESEDFPELDFWGIYIV